MDEHQMNKRIKELAEQAGLEQERWSTTSQFESFLEKFAELIVQECASMARVFNVSPEPEPVATVYEGVIVKSNLPEKFTGLLYTSPQRAEGEAPKREPLTDAELRVIENKINPNMRWRSSDEEGITLYPQEYYELVKAIEAAHGIKEKNT